MYDIRPLEEEWKKYKKNKRKPYFYISGVLISIILGSYAFFNYKSNTLSTLSGLTNVSTTKNINYKENSILLNLALTELQVPIKEKIEEIKPTVQMHIEKSTYKNVPTLPVVDDIPILDEKPKVKSLKKKPKIVQVSQEKRKKPRKKMHLNIIESSSVSAYKDVEKRFYESHDTDDSLFLAKSYYRKGNYKKSEYWSLQTNKVNNNIEESWIIFAKSKAKLGRKNEAIRILTNYVKRSNSHTVRNLLYKLKKN